MLYEMLTGERPFAGDSHLTTLTAILTRPVPDLSRPCPDAPDALVDLVYRMLEKDRSARIPSVRLVGAELEALLGGDESRVSGSGLRVADREGLPTTTSRFSTPIPPAGAPSRNLPVQPTPFVGREAELVELDRLLSDPDVRLVTVLGAGGMGKTRLALEAAARQLDRYTHGVFFVSLASLWSADAIVPTIAQALGFSFYGGGEPRQQLLDYLRAKRMLLLLDNYEHLLASPARGADGDRAVDIVAEILTTAPDVRLLTTSRARLDVQGEHLFRLSGMHFPDWETPEDAMEYSAVKLFLQSARRVRPDLELAAGDLRYVARICRLVGGMPLGILLAAAWIEMLSPGEIATEVQRSLDFLESGSRDLPTRQRSVRAVYNHSWNLLTEGEQGVFAALSVFRGGFTRQAAQQVTGASLRQLMSLVDRSLLFRRPTGRYEVHELLRQYAAERLGRSPDAGEAAHDRHCAYYARFLAQRRDAFLKRGPGDALVEMANIRAAWRWALQHGRIPEIRQSMEGIFWLGESTGVRHSGEGTALARAVGLLRRAEPTQENQLALGLALCYHAVLLAGPRIREEARPLAQEGLSLLRRRASGRALALGHILATFSGVAKDEAHHKQLLEQGLAIAQKEDGPLEACWALNLLAWAALRHDQYDEAEQHWLTFLRIAGEIDHRRGRAIALGGLGHVARFQGQYARARTLYEQSLAIFRELGVRSWIVNRLDNLGEVALGLGDLEQARARYREALSSAEELADLDYVACALRGLGDIALAAGDILTARRRYRRALQVPLEDQRVDTSRGALVSLARWYAYVGEQELAVELVALALCERPGSWLKKRRGAEALLGELRSGLSPDVYAAARERGRARSLDATLRELLADLEANESPK
jgi:predicted ATPase/tetratricopeptide (TPR) repeat protein